jgi:hypothetical protein
MRQRILFRAVVSIVLIAIVVATAVQLQLRLLRFRSEQLLSDIKSLEMRKSTWADAQHLMRKWGEWGHYDGTCTSEYCDYTIRLGDFFYRHRQLMPDSPWIREQYGRIGGRIIVVTAGLLVYNGVVWGKAFFLDVAVPPDRRPDAPFRGYGYTLMASAEGVSHFLAGYRPAQVSHPYYRIDTPDGCTGCLAVWARFIPMQIPSK